MRQSPKNTVHLSQSLIRVIELNPALCTVLDLRKTSFLPAGKWIGFCRRVRNPSFQDPLLRLASDALKRRPFRSWLSLPLEQYETVKQFASEVSKGCIFIIWWPTHWSVMSEAKKDETETVKAAVRPWSSFKRLITGHWCFQHDPLPSLREYIFLIEQEFSQTSD